MARTRWRSPQALVGAVVALVSARQFRQIVKVLAPDVVPAGYWTHVGVALNIVIALIAAAGVEFSRAPTGFIPEQDQGYLITVVQLPPGASLTRTEQVVKQAVDIILTTPGIEHVAPFAGLDATTFTVGSNSGTIFSGLPSLYNHQLPGITANSVLADLRRRLMLIYHPVGTARMSDTHEQAVVDSQLRVHGLDSIVRTGDGRELATYLRALFGDANLAEELRTNGAETAARYTWSHVLDSLGRKVEYVNAVAK